MKAKKFPGHPILFSIMLGVVLTLLVTIASAISEILKFSNNSTLLAQTGAFLVMAIILIIYMTNKGKSLTMFGFKNFQISKTKEVLYYIPLLVIALVQPVIGGINTKLPFVELIIIIIFSFVVGFTEETLFRGIVKEKLQSKGRTFYIIFSSVFFGILHIANAFNGDVLAATFQVANAFLVGIILAQLFITIDNIIPLIAFHFIYDALAQATNVGANGKETLMLAILSIMYILYAIYLGVILKKKSKFKILTTL